MFRTASTILFASTLALFALSASAQIGNSGGRVDPDQLAKYGNAPTGPQALRDKGFIHKAGESSLTEIELSKLALTRTKRDDIKSFAQLMIDDHTKLLAALKPVADSMDGVLPKKLEKPDAAESARLSALSGPDFDKEYLAFMTAAHQKDLDMFTAEAPVASTPALAAVVQEGRKSISLHLAMVQKLSTT